MSPTSIERALRLKELVGRNNLSFVKADLFDLPYPDGHFDVVFSEGVIQHFRPGGSPSREAALREMVRVLRPGGYLITAVLNWHCYPHTLYKAILRARGVPYEYGFEQSFTKGELRRTLEGQGLEVGYSAAYYPAHAFFRLARYWPMFRTLGGLVDRHAAAWFSARFGFERVMLAKKSGADSGDHHQTSNT